MNKLSTRVRVERARLDLSQEQFARKLNLTNITISKIENGQKVGPKSIKTLAKYFKVDTLIIRKEMLENENN